MKKIILLFLFLSGLSVNAQNLDSLFNEYVKIKTGTVTDIKGVRVAATGEETKKCAFGIVNSVRANFDNFNPKLKEMYIQLSMRPNTDTSFVTPSGKFRIHYFKSGNDAPGYDLNELAIAADSSYNYEVNILGYPAPPEDYGTSTTANNPDNLYDIYIKDLSYYGYTEADVDLGNSKHTTYIVIDNDFSNHNTKGINGARVTVAHEFHHMIQMGNYIYRPEDTFYHEITSVTMEEFVFDSINDYYHDLASFMRNPQNSFASNSGYNLAIWNLFLSSQFDPDIIKRIWEIMPDKRALNAIADAISERESSFKKEFAIFGHWLYFTGPRALPGRYFEEAANYPMVNPFITMSFSKPETMFDVNSEPVSTNILVFTNNTGRQIDTFVTIVSNIDITNGVNNQSSVTKFKYRLSDQPAQGFRKVLDGYYSKIESSSDFLLAETNVFNNFSVGDGEISSEEIEYAFPQPFRYSRDNFIYFPASVSQRGIVEVYIYSVDMDLVYSGEARILALDKVVVQWNGKDNSGNKLNSGIYFFVIKSGDTIKKGKFAVFND